MFPTNYPSIYNNNLSSYMISAQEPNFKFRCETSFLLS